jgi:hypothetical protein
MDNTVTQSSISVLKKKNMLVKIVMEPWRIWLLIELNREKVDLIFLFF